MDIYSTRTLEKLARTVKSPPTFFLDTFFPLVQIDDKREILFDIETDSRQVAPFVYPNREGKIVASEGYQTKTLLPAYIKDKREIPADKPLYRLAGEEINGSFSKEERLLKILQREMEKQQKMWIRRLEVMAALTVKDASLTISSDEYPARTVVYGRDGTHTVNLTLGARWSQSTSDPSADLEDWNQKILDKTGLGATKVVMDRKAWALFRKHDAVKGQLDLRRVKQADMDLVLSQKKEGAQYMGNFGGFEIYTYTAWYVNSAGAQVPILPDNTVMMIGNAYEGVRAFGAIVDLEAKTPTDRFWKSWEEKDPSARFLMLQSAPLTYPRLPDASITATVHS